MNKHYLRIDIVSDVVCPWCVIGYRRLQLALQEFPGRFEVKEVWHPFELNPDMPEAGENLREHIARKYRTTTEESHSNRQRITALGAELGFQFNFSDEMRIYNTRSAHQLMHWAETSGKQSELSEQLFSAYFTHGKNLNHSSELLEAVDRAGLDRDAAEEALNDPANLRQVQIREEQLLLQGIQGVPLFMFDHSYAISGAQDTDTFIRQLQEILHS